MWALLCFVLFLTKFGFIRSDDNGMVNIKIDAGQNCTLLPSYTFTEGETVTIVVTFDHHVKHGWWRQVTPLGTKDLYSELKTTQEGITHNATVIKSMEGIWEFKFYYLGSVNYQSSNRILYEGTSYTQSVCTTNVTIVSIPQPEASTADSKKDTTVIALAVLCGCAFITIIGQAVYIVYLKKQAKQLNAHNNLSKKTESVSNDTARYCSNPGQKILRETEDDDNRDSVIYEAPNIQLPGRPMQPPQPPAIATMPRTPRPEHNMFVAQQAIQQMIPHSPQSNNHPVFPRPKMIEREISVVNRPPLALPDQTRPDHEPPKFEVYDDADRENTYESPPTISPRLPMPPRKVPTANLVDVKENTLKTRNLKPQVTPKPHAQRQPIAPVNELEQALRRRNPELGMTKTNEQPNHRRIINDAPVNELEEALRWRNAKQAPVSNADQTFKGPAKRQPPAVKSKPKAIQPIQDEYGNDSDDEWTYEPLKPLNAYDENIYNI